MNGSDHLIPDVNSQAGFSRLLALMGFNRWLLGVAAAIFVWGFQPFILSPDVRALRTASDPLFVVIRYGAAFAVFALAYGLLRWLTRSRRAVNTTSITRRTVLAALGMGATMYLSRLFELASYGPNGEDSVFATFGMIFSIFFVVVWNWKNWVIFYFSRRLRGGWLRTFGSPPPTAEGFLSWMIQAVLVVSAALFFVYAESGSLPSGPEAKQSLLWALGSALMLSFYYDLCMQPFKDPDAWVSGRELARIHMISTGAVAVFALGDWAFRNLSISGMAQDLTIAIDVLQSFRIEQHAKLWGGYILGITCIGYFGENLGVLLYDKHHRFAWRIEGREWLGLTATMDPFVGVLVTMSPLVAHESDHRASVYYLVAAVLVAAVTLQSFLRLWSAKHESLRSKALGMVAQAMDERHGSEAFAVLLRWMLRLSMIRKEAYPRLECNMGGDTLDRQLVNAVSRSHHYPHDGCLCLTPWSIDAEDSEHDDVVGSLFDYETSEGRGLWRHLAAHVTIGTDTQLIRWEEAATLIGAERGLPGMGEQPSRPKGSIVFFATHASLAEVRPRPFPTRIAVLAKSDVQDQAAISRLREKILGREGHTRLGDGAVYIDPLRHYRLAVADIIASEGARGLTIDADLIMMESRFLDGDVPERLAGGPNTPPVLLWSDAHASVLVGELLGGRAQISDRGLPLISELGRDGTHLGGYAFLEALTVARHRNEILCRIVVITSDDGVRTAIVRHLRPALIGMRADIRCPASLAEMQRDLTELSEHLPLVFFTPTLDGWDGHRQVNALVEMAPHLPTTDPYLVQLATPLANDSAWPLERRVNLERTPDFSRAVAGHLGDLEPETGTFKYLTNSQIEERFQAVFTGINADVRSWSLRSHCYAIYAFCGKVREHG